MSQTNTTRTALKGQTPDTLPDNLKLLQEALATNNRSQVCNMLSVLRTRHSFAQQWPRHVDSTGVAAAIQQAENYLNSNPEQPAK